MSDEELTEYFEFAKTMREEERNGKGPLDDNMAYNCARTGLVFLRDGITNPRLIARIDALVGEQTYVDVDDDDLGCA